MIEQWALTLWRPQRGGQSGRRKKVTKRGVLTSYRPQRAEIRTQKESDRARGTHSLETTVGGTSQDM